MPRAVLPLTVALAALALSAPGALAAESSKTETKTVGDVTAELTYTRGDEIFDYKDVRLKITRGGQVLHDAPVPPPCEEFCSTIPAGMGEGESLQADDVNSDNEWEIWVDLYTGGAHCCTYTQLYHYRPATNGYSRVKHFWGDPGYVLKDLDSDGTPEFRSADPDFSSAFTAYVLSAFPIQIWRFGGGRFNDVTREFRRLIKADLRSKVKIYKQIRRDEGGDVRGFLAAYVADKLLLGQASTAFDLVYAAYRRGELRPRAGDTSVSGKRYISALRKFLRRTGYL